MNYPIELLLWPLAKAVWDRLSTDPAMDGVELRRPGQGVDLRVSPYVEVGAVYLGERGTEPAYGAEAVVQLDAFAAVPLGGAAEASALCSAALTALTRADLAVPTETHGPDGTPGDVTASFTRVENAILRYGYDRALDLEHAHHDLRLRFTITN